MLPFEEAEKVQKKEEEEEEEGRDLVEDLKAGTESQSST